MSTFKDMNRIVVVAMLQLANMNHRFIILDDCASSPRRCRYVNFDQDEDIATLKLRQWRLYCALGVSATICRILPKISICRKNCCLIECRFNNEAQYEST